MSNFTNASARRLARQLFDLAQKKRKDILDALDSDFRAQVLEAMAILNSDMPLEKRDTAPMRPIPPLYPGHHDNEEY